MAKVSKEQIKDFTHPLTFTQVMRFAILANFLGIDDIITQINERLPDAELPQEGFEAAVTAIMDDLCNEHFGDAKLEMHVLQVPKGVSPDDAAEMFFRSREESDDDEYGFGLPDFRNNPNLN